MRFLTNDIRTALFKGASGPNWVSRVQAISLRGEGIAFIADNVEYLLEFVGPLYQGGIGYDTGMQLPDKNGGCFLPKFAHRHISLWDDYNNLTDGMKEICAEPAKKPWRTSDNFGKTMQRALLTYVLSYPNVDQYFFEASPEFANYVEHHVLHADPSLDSSFSVEMLKEIAEPQYGFMIRNKQGGQHG